MIRFTVKLATALLLSSALIAPAMAQTAMHPPGANSRITPKSSTVHTQHPVPARPVTEKMLSDAQDHNAGFYPDMVRGGVGGQIQDAWSMSEARDGVHKFRICEDCVYKIRTREFMATTVLLPTDAQILDADLGDKRGFRVEIKARNMLTIQPTTYGIDTNLNVYTKSGAVYPFYLRAESFNSVFTPDILVKFLSEETPTEINGIVNYSSGLEALKPINQSNKVQTSTDKVSSAIDGLTAPTAKNGEFVRTVEFDPGKLRGWADYNVWGDEILPHEKIVIFRDDQFTYIKVDKDVWDTVELPVAYVVVDGIDEVVNTRVQGTTIIIEKAHGLISLKSGKKFMCIKYTGEDA